MNFDFETIIYSILATIIGFTLHEYMHAYAAFRLGDNTAKEQGRLTFNPIKHIDPLGMIFILIAGFGWAKPVQFDPENLKHKRRDRAIIALAGPLSNLALGLISLLTVKIAMMFFSIQEATGAEVFFNVFMYIGLINLGLFIFNILPIPPLDGSHLFFTGLNISKEKEALMYKFGTYGLFAIIIIESRLKVDILPIGRFIDFIVGLIF